MNDILFGGGEVENMALWTFAGLTPGGTTFNDYFNTTLMPNNQDFEWRIQNSLDVAPLLWGSNADVEVIYTPYDLPLEAPLVTDITDLFEESYKANADYPLAQTGVVIPGTFAQTKLNSSNNDAWYDQASHQHSFKDSYQGLVNQQYPYPPFDVKL